MNTPDKNKKLSQRLVDILEMLNNGEKLSVPELVQKFKVDIRTIQRDVERLRFLGLEWTSSRSDIDGIERRFYLHPSQLGKLTAKDLRDFAALAGVKHLFPVSVDKLLHEFVKMRISEAFLVKGHHYEDLAGKEPLFKKLGEAIQANRMIQFRYAKQNELKSYENVEPYRLVNQKGIWYLAARHDGKLKSFAFSKLESVLLLETLFKIDPALQSAINKEDGVWLSEEKQEVILKVDAEVADYFLRRALVPHQEIAKELEGGGLLISSKVPHKNQILPIVRYWIPHVRIVSPESWQTELEDGLQKYFKNTRSV